MATLSHSIDLSFLMITNIKITVQITCKMAGNLRFIFDCNIALKFGGKFGTKISIKMISQS
jgi:hypothetical protein